MWPHIIHHLIGPPFVGVSSPRSCNLALDTTWQIADMAHKRDNPSTSFSQTVGNIAVPDCALLRRTIREKKLFAGTQLWEGGGGGDRTAATRQLFFHDTIFFLCAIAALHQFVEAGVKTRCRLKSALPVYTVCCCSLLDWRDICRLSATSGGALSRFAAFQLLIRT